MAVLREDASLYLRLWENRDNQEQRELLLKEIQESTGPIWDAFRKLVDTREAINEEEAQKIVSEAFPSDEHKAARDELFIAFTSLPAVDPVEELSVATSENRLQAPTETLNTSVTEDEVHDTTFRSILTGIKRINKQKGSQMGVDLLKKYEFVLYAMAQISRIVYCDSGIGRLVLEKAWGLHPDIVNKVISTYDKHYRTEKTKPLTSQTLDDKTNRPMESYALGAAPDLDTNKPYAIYISSPEDCTCILIKPTSLIGKPNSIFTENDYVLCFKGSSTMANMKHDLLSQFTAANFESLLAPYGGVAQNVGNKVPSSFVNTLLHMWSALRKGLDQFVGQHPSKVRLFVTGHSLGGAFATYFAYICAENRTNNNENFAFLKNVESLHLITYGAPTVVSDKARNSFNTHLDSGFLTYDRVVDQLKATLSPTPGPYMDIIPLIPAGFSHPGYKPLLTEFKPEEKGRPYSIDRIRTYYGSPSKTRYRDAATWPFEQAAEPSANEIKQLVKQLTALEPPSEMEEEKESSSIMNQLKSLFARTKSPPTTEQSGGVLGLGKEKGIYEKATKTHMPNFVSIRGTAKPLGSFAHAEYLGMFFYGGFRLAGMKNPAKTATAFFSLTTNGVKIEYVPFEKKGGARFTRRSRLFKDKTRKL
jgi:hypothetical protein